MTGFTKNNNSNQKKLIDFSRIKYLKILAIKTNYKDALMSDGWDYIRMENYINAHINSLINAKYDSSLLRGGNK